jgi:hypothetical protein
MTTPAVRRIPLRTFTDERGSLTVVEPGDGRQPFDIHRVFFLHGIPPGQSRGAHAHRRVDQLIIALHGHFDVCIEVDGQREVFRLDRPDEGLLVPPLHWGELHDFAPGAVALVLASEPYDEAEYIRTYDEFKQLSR